MLIYGAHACIQAVANTITAYTDFRALSPSMGLDPPAAAAEEPRVRGVGVGLGGESRILEVLCEVMEARAPPLLEGRANELSAIVRALPSCGVTARSRPALWQRLAQVCWSINRPLLPDK